MTSPCPGCLVELEEHDGPTHRYIGASAACWDVYSRALAGDPHIGSSRGTVLLVDAYAAQHPGESSPQATQSTAVHLVVLHAVLDHGYPPGDLVRLRREAVAVGRNRGGFPQLLPAPSSWGTTLHDVVAVSDRAAREESAEGYPEAVLAAWSTDHGDVISQWYSEAS